MSAAKILFGLEKALENFLRTVCDDYALPYEELYDRYFLPKNFDEALSEPLPEASASAIAAHANPKPSSSSSSSNNKGKSKATDKPTCAALTTKKTPCKKFAIDGSRFCACHAKTQTQTIAETEPKTPTKAVNPEDDQMSDAGGEVPVPKAPVKKRPVKASAKSKAKSKAKSPPPPPPPPETPSDTEDETDTETCDDCHASTSANPTKKQSKYDFDTDVKTRLSSILSQIDSHDPDGDGSDTEE